MKKAINLFYKNSPSGASPKKELEFTKFGNGTAPISKEHIKTPVENADAGNEKSVPEVLVVTSYPPRECGIATYSQDLIRALNDKFNNSFSLKVCALETDNEKHSYSESVEYLLNTDHSDEYKKLAKDINRNTKIKIVLIQHEFGFYHKHEGEFLNFLNSINKPIVIAFHTVLPNADEAMKSNVQNILDICSSVIVMTHNAADILLADYKISENKISVIPHGIHLVPHLDKMVLKEKYHFSGRKVLTTFGLLSSGKGIETTLDALPEIVKRHGDVAFLIIGKTHPVVVKHEGEQYRSMLEKKVAELKLENNVFFINKYIKLPDLLEYLQLTDIYLFTSKDPNQAVSGTFSYAMSCGCPIVSTPIPHAKELLGDGTGIIIDFNNTKQLSDAVNRLLSDEELRFNISSNSLHKIVSTAWENSAVAHSLLLEKVAADEIILNYTIPEVNLNHFKRMTTDFGMIQFSKINHPDIESGYTLDDNARALIAICQHYKLTDNESDLEYISIYFNFIKHCLQTEGYFLNYVDEKKGFTEQNNSTNLSDANGRAIWALGYMISMGDLLPEELIAGAEEILEETLFHVNAMHSTRAMAFTIKGLYYCSNIHKKSKRHTYMIEALANRMVQMYKHESDNDWDWFESYLTYANSILPEAMLCAYAETGNEVYKTIAKSSFDFLLSRTFNKEGIKVVSNRSWMHKGEVSFRFGEQPIDVAYTILALSRFYDVFKEKDYLTKMERSFNWFLGKNHLHRIIYNPCTGGCYDGLEEDHVNLNQGAESTVSYLMARLTMEKYFNCKQKEFFLPTSRNKEKQLA